MVYEGIVDISNGLNDYVGTSHQLYQAAQKESKENQALFENKQLERKRFTDEISTLKGAKKVVCDFTANKVTKIDSKLKSFKEK